MKTTIALSLLLLPSLLFGHSENAQLSTSLSLKQAATLKAVAPLVTEVLELTPEALSAPRDLGNLKVLQGNNTFMVWHDGKVHKVENHNIDSSLRGISTAQLKEFLVQDDGYIKVQRKSDGQFALDGQARLRGGGIVGAKIGFFTGKFLTHLLAQGGIVIVTIGTSIVATPAVGIAVGAALEKTITPAVEIASNVVGLGGGIIGGVATGPI